MCYCLRAIFHPLEVTDLADFFTGAIFSATGHIIQYNSIL